ncbi:MAG: hypothetical protein ACYC69_17275 [Thermodesulfovibrionales bacterium]
MKKNINAFAVLVIAAIFVCGLAFNASAAGKCPDKSVVKSISSDSPDFKDAKPNMSGIKASKAMVTDGGKTVKVFLSNASYTAKQMNNDMGEDMK